jgi:hypothetical protein
MAKDIYTVTKTQYKDYLDKLTDSQYRLSEVAQNVTVRGSLLVSLYTLCAMENNTARMAEVLLLLEDVYNEDITAPTLISGLESEAAQAYTKAVTAGTNTITFNLVLSSANYALFIDCYDANGSNMSYKRTNKLTTGFTIYVPENGFIDYRAIIV